MARITLYAVFLFSLTVLAIPAPQPELNPDPAQNFRAGNGKGEQFIGGRCLSSADCGSGCCASLRDLGICSGLGAQFQQGKKGCGFGDHGAAPTSAAPAPTQAPSAGNGNGNGNGQNPNQGTGNGSQFITGPCDSDKDCASGCCSPAARDGAFATCAARAVAEESGGRGCGFSLA
ncbi:hypothetical protein M426DRAFT_153599 [Hypoxylon sp. CI-4A]|nr:hypothetical protein M426DRAFT_153599 [Hypoxylon sp. CI-4A]